MSCSRKETPSSKQSPENLWAVQPALHHTGKYTRNNQRFEMARQSGTSRRESLRARVLRSLAGAGFLSTRILIVRLFCLCTNTDPTTTQHASATQSSSQFYRAPVSGMVTIKIATRTYRVWTGWLGPARLSSHNNLVNREHRPRRLCSQLDRPLLGNQQVENALLFRVQGSRAALVLIRVNIPPHPYDGDRENIPQYPHPWTSRLPFGVRHTTG